MEKYVTLANGLKMPMVGLGTFKAEDGSSCYNAVLAALKAGYRHIDTAMGYGNEESVGKAIKDSGLSREDIFVTTKLFPKQIGYKSAKYNLHESLKRLGLSYVDLYLIHWPSANAQVNTHTWQAFEELYEAGLCKAIGVSNFNINHLDRLLASCRIKPMVNQVELHPYLNQKPLIAYLQNEGIAVESYGSFAKGMVFEDQVLADIAKKYQVSTTYVINLFDKKVELKRLNLPEVLSIDEVYGRKLTYKGYCFVLYAPQWKKIVDVLDSRKKLDLID